MSTTKTAHGRRVDLRKSNRSWEASCPITALLALTVLPVSALAQVDQEKIADEDIEEVIVSAVRESSYRVEDTSTAGLFDMALSDTPFNVGVITEEFIEDRQLFTLREAVLSNASVTRTHSHSSTSAQFNIRGFGLNADRLGYLINGVPVAANDAPPAHVSALERIEVLKGASTLYYGAGEPAGVINYVYKTPLEEARYSISTTVGEYGDYRAELDATGPLGSDALLYRFTLGWRDSDSPVDFDYAKDFAPTLQFMWRPSDNTTLRFIGEYVDHESNPLSQDAVFLDGDYLDTPENTYFGFSTDYEEQESAGVQLHLDHVFSDTLKLRAQVGWKDGGRDAGNSGYMVPLPFVIPGVNDPANGILARSAFDQRREAKSQYAAVHLAWETEFAGLNHDIVVGVNYSDSEITNIGFFNSLIGVLPQLFGGDFSVLATLPPSANVFDPVTVEYDHRNNFADSPPFYQDVWKYDNIGLNFQDAIEISEWNLQFLLGLRYTTSGAETVVSVEEDGSLGIGFGPDTEESAWIPRFGAIYDINDNHNLYVSYGETFKPPFTNSLDRNGNPITEPETGVQYEFGWRGSFFDGNLSTTLAFYDLTKENIVVATGVPNVSDLSGEQRSRGVELDLTGRVNDYWDLYFSYAYTDTEVVDAGTSSQTEGDRFAGVPLHKAVLWNNFSLGWTGIEGLSFGYGADYMSSTLAGALTDPIALTFGNVETPAQGVVHNANLTYVRDTNVGNLNLNLGFLNFTNREYVLNTSNTLFARRGQPSTVLLTAQLTF
ncbi:MAG: TonB-dependent receptor [Pseudomonadota bacterium]